LGTCRGLRRAGRERPPAGREAGRDEAVLEKGATIGEAVTHYGPTPAPLIGRRGSRWQTTAAGHAAPLPPTWNASRASWGHPCCIILACTGGFCPPALAGSGPIRGPAGQRREVGGGGGGFR